jgi:predicted ATPase
MIHADQSVLHRRYILLEQLGAGAMGAVFRTHDILTDNVIALKRVMFSEDRSVPVSPDDSSFDLRLALAHEFRTLASLRHPHVINVLDYGFDMTQQPYYTMDFMEAARSLVEVGQDQTLEFKISLLIQMLQALAYLHRRDVLHRDLKPANVLVSNGMVKVLDFGLSTSVQDQHDAEGSVVGTLAYIAPELFQGEPPSAAADLYAVGIMAYELLAGRHPFMSKDGNLRLSDVVYTRPDMSPLKDIAPQDASSDNSANTPTVAAVIERLLSKNPAERYQQAYHVIQDLSRAMHQPLPVENEAIRESFLKAAKFVGRDKEFEILEQALHETRDGHGAAWIIGGENGVGKSRLLDELRIHALVSGTLVLRGQAEDSGAVPYQLWRTPLRRLLLTTDVTDVDAAILKDLVPDIDQLLGRSIPASVPLEGTAYQQRLFGTIISLFQRQTTPILLLLEDIQWSPESLDILQLLTGIVHDQPLLIVASYSRDENPDLPARLPNMKLMTLKRLSSGGIAELSVSMLGEQGRTPDLVKYLEAETEGNILFLVEVVRSLVQDAGQLEEIGRVTLPKNIMAGGIQRIIAQRLSRVPEASRRLLQFAALFGRELDLDVLEILKDDQDIEEWLTICANTNVIEIHDEVWHFSHRKLQETTFESIPADQLTQFQRRAAEALEQVYSESPERAAAIAERWRAAGDVEKELPYTSQAGDFALQISAFEDAIEHFERSLVLLDLLPETTSVEIDAIRAALQLKLGETRKYLSDYPEAQTHLEEALALYRTSNDQDGMARTLAELADLLILWGDYTRAAQVCDEALQLYRDLDDSFGVSRVLDRMGMTQFQQGHYDEATRLSSESLELSRSIQDTKGIARAVTTLGVTAFAQGKYADAMQYFNETLTLGRLSGERRKAALALMNLGSAAGSQGDYEAASQYFEEALSIFRVIGERRGVAMTLDNLGVMADLLKDYPTAHSYFEESLEIGRAIGNLRGIAATLVNLGNVTQAQNQPGAASVYYRQALEQAHMIDATSTALESLVGLAIVHDDRPQAIQWLGLVLAHPAAYDATRQLIETTLADARQKEDPTDIDQWLEQGKMLDYAAVVEQILASDNL